jgi:hypothetical protein
MYNSIGVSAQAVQRSARQGALRQLNIVHGTSALTQTEDTGIGASFSKIALAEVVHTNGRQSLLWALM